MPRWTRDGDDLPEKDSTPKKDTTPVKDSVPKEVVAPIKDSAPKEVVAPIKDSRPEEVVTPKEEIAPVAISDGAPDRIHEAENFEVPEFKGLILEQLVGLVFPGTPQDEPDVVFIKAKGKDWQQFFIDAKLGFWEDLKKFEKEYEEDWYVDYTEEFKLENQKIDHITCVNSSIEIHLDSKKIISLASIDPSDELSCTRLSLS